MSASAQTAAGWQRAAVVSRMVEDGASRAEAEGIERAAFNSAVRAAECSRFPASWFSPVFVAMYSGRAMYAVRNSAQMLQGVRAGRPSDEVFRQAPHELRPDVWASLREAKRARESAYSRRPEANTRAFRCPRCGSAECRYFEMQTRSGDEPMTLFVSCTVCEHRWTRG